MLTADEIEDLLGLPLPEAARLSQPGGRTWTRMAHRRHNLVRGSTPAHRGAEPSGANRGSSALRPRNVFARRQLMLITGLFITALLVVLA
jgi:hypothetical protein